MFTTFRTNAPSRLNNGAFHKFYSSPNWIVEQLFMSAEELLLHNILRDTYTLMNRKRNRQVSSEKWKMRVRNERKKERKRPYLFLPIFHGPWPQHEALLQNLKEHPSSPTQNPGRKKREWRKRNRIMNWQNI